MSKALLQFLALAGCFFALWYSLSRFDFVKKFHVEEVTREEEHKLGDVVLEAACSGHEEIRSDTVLDCLNSIKHRLCAANGIADSTIKIHLIKDDDINAFSLPDNHLLIYSGLIDYCKSPEELAGVMAHEIGHIEAKHVMKKLVKDVGLAMLATLAGGQAGGEIARQVAQTLSSTAFDREQESEADAAAVHILAKANIDPRCLADFLFRLSQEKADMPKSFELISDHPNSKDRSAEILELRKKEHYAAQQVLNDDEWKTLKGDAESVDLPR
ncbi:MAG TPA: M48 family metallopeptidase [Bacteroidota bacterium]|nr:M48 family metallopeptidase [Bacteroidota bacterium]